MDISKLAEDGWKLTDAQKVSHFSDLLDLARMGLELAECVGELVQCGLPTDKAGRAQVSQILNDRTRALRERSEKP